MGSEVHTRHRPVLRIEVTGTDRIASVELVREGKVDRTWRPGTRHVDIRLSDEPLPAGRGFRSYYVRVTQTDADEEGNPSRAWSSPIWVRP